MADEPGVDQCGPAPLARYAWQGPDGAWVPACQAHDRAYRDRDVPRDEADRDLLAGLLLHSTTRTHRAVAWSYWLACRALGWVFWR